MHPLLVDARWINNHGIGRFAREVLSRLDCEWSSVPDTLPLLSPLEPLALSNLIRRSKPSAYFSPGYNPPLFNIAPLVFCIHDLIHLKVPGAGSMTKRLYYHLVVRRAVHFARRVVTVTEFSRRELLSWSGAREEKILVVGNGVSEHFSPHGPWHQPGFPYLFAIGNPKPHKNIPRLLRALARTEIPRHIGLLLSGPEHSTWKSLIHHLGLGGRVHCTGTIPEPELPSYYRGAIGVVVPSLYEGFGLPVIEAMACGTPVLAAKTAALPETAGDAAVYCDPLEISSISAGIAELINNANLREHLRLAGLARAHHYPWATVAQNVSNILRRDCGVGCSRLK